jgi:hypothetical protein
MSFFRSYLNLHTEFDHTVHRETEEGRALLDISVKRCSRQMAIPGLFAGM